MYYKVMKNDKVIDVLDKLVYLKYQTKHNRMILCKEAEAQAIFSSDKRNVWHIDSLYPIPVDGYDTVELIEIDVYEYDQLKILNGRTPQEIIDFYTMSLLEEGVL